MKQTKNYDVGVSTLWMPTKMDGQKSIFDSLERVIDKGFDAIEIVPGRFPRANYPRDKTSVGFSPDKIGEKFLGKLEEALAFFGTVAVHSPHMELNIASMNKGIRKESVRQFTRCIDIGERIGADVITFHHGGAVGGTNPELEPLIDHNVKFGRKAARRAEETGIEMGYEVLGGTIADRELELLKETISRIGSPKFGINLDVGHVNLVNGGDAVDWAEEFKNEVKEIHLHGTYYRSDRSPGFTTHSPVSQEDCIDFKDLFSALKGSEFSGPIITEIHAPTIEKYLEFSREARQMVECVSVNQGETE